MHMSYIYIYIYIERERDVHLRPRRASCRGALRVSPPGNSITIISNGLLLLLCMNPHHDYQLLDYCYYDYQLRDYYVILIIMTISY